MNKFCVLFKQRILKRVCICIFVGASVKADEEEFLRVLESRAKDGGKIKVVDVNKKESEVEVKELTTLSKVIEDLKATFPGLTHNRIPVCNSAAPLEPDFDTLCNALLGSNVNAPVIVNCQVRERVFCPGGVVKGARAAFVETGENILPHTFPL